MGHYDNEFYDVQYQGSMRSAGKLLSKLFSDFKPKSVVDFGCGIGSWLCVAESLGVNNLVGLDGEWVTKDQLLSKNIHFHAVDFQSEEENYLSKLLSLNACCELAISVEVAEHFDESYANRFVKSIACSSDLIIFGAAVPLQGGTNHVNEQPQSYWINKFKREGFLCFDYFRPDFWNDPEVETWYKQNTFLFVREEKLQLYPFLQEESQVFIENIIHPDLFMKKINDSMLQRADKLRDAALEIEKENLYLANILMEMARESRPKGPYIIKKLGEYNRLLSKGSESISSAEDRLVEVFEKFKHYTMLNKQCYLANLELVEGFSSLDGAIVECGTWKGGMIAGIAELLGNNHIYYLFDSFEGLPQAQEIDGKGALEWQKNKDSPSYYDNCSAPKGDAIKAMKLAGVDDVVVKKGWFNETLKGITIDGGISILRMDADWYESTLDIMNNLFSQVKKGGLIIIDDYHTWDGCSKAVHDYLSKNCCEERISQFRGVCYIIKK
ncbi:TylF/MycF/NovP-related O-methyltransferase [Amphritea balenae]|uniref:TylF/MycF/NovP-related O-methyltransferase n=1 Tax=Amphritea balenae TaxID=452629 RepID=UPI00147301B0|nr:TylF/MycF/NovP-related O-methyltransferase [Amphritea balenae]